LLRANDKFDFVGVFEQGNIIQRLRSTSPLLGT
jgi:hypothetical protein